MSSPRIVTMRADNFITGVIVITAVLFGIIFNVIIKPANTLPQARRLMGLITSAGVSSIGERGAMRVLLRDTR